MFARAKSCLQAYTRSRREDAFEIISHMALHNLAHSPAHGQRQADAAWRRAVQTWLQREGIIALIQPTVSPGFHEIRSHKYGGSTEDGIMLRRLYKGQRRKDRGMYNRLRFCRQEVGERGLQRLLIWMWRRWRTCGADMHERLPGLV